MTAIAANTITATIGTMLSSTASSPGMKASDQAGDEGHDGDQSHERHAANTAASIGTAAIIAMNTACWP